MKPLYIFDLEGTTGIYSSGTHLNDIIELRSGFKKIIEDYNDGILNMAIATRAPKQFVDQIRKNMKRKGLELTCKVYTQEDVQFNKIGMINYKDYSQVYEYHKISNPSSDAVVFGDFLRFSPIKSISKDEFLSHNIAENSEPLTTNHALNDHPFPENGATPIYAVLPQLWSTYENGRPVSLDFSYVMGFLDHVYTLGQFDFEDGFKRIMELGIQEAVVSDRLSKEVLGIEHQQRYLVFRGENKDWKPLDIIM